jgi:hypothetical protein
MTAKPAAVSLTTQTGLTTRDMSLETDPQTDRNDANRPQTGMT